MPQDDPRGGTDTGPVSASAIVTGTQSLVPPVNGVEAPVVDVVVPVYDEVEALRTSVERLHAYLSDRFPFSARITIADNGSTDGTLEVALMLAEEFSGVRAVRLEQKGRGRAISTVWSESDARVLVYMDVDLSTDLAALLPLVAPLISGHSDLAIGSRLTHGARVVRGPKRELISRSYNAILHLVLRTRFSDAQCGFKAIRADRARELLPLVHDRAWFFDTELLVVAERAGLRIHEVPVDWVDDPDSRVDIVSTSLADLRGVMRLVARRHTDSRFAGQVARFLVVGVLSTAAYGLLYLILRSQLPAQGANALALLLTAVGNTAANRRFTFAIRGTAHRLRHQLQGLAVFALALALTASSLALLHAVVARPSRALELGVLIVANLVATILRFVLLRSWVFRSRRAAP